MICAYNKSSVFVYVCVYVYTLHTILTFCHVMHVHRSKLCIFLHKMLITLYIIYKMHCILPLVMYVKMCVLNHRNFPYGFFFSTTFAHVLCNFNPKFKKTFLTRI